jgi:hypothetical protein
MTVVGHECDALRDRLGDQHAIEGALVMARQPGDCLGMAELEPAGGTPASKLSGNRSLPSATLIAASQALATLTKTTLAEAMCPRDHCPAASCSPATR